MQVLQNSLNIRALLIRATLYHHYWILELVLQPKPGAEASPSSAGRRNRAAGQRPPIHPESAKDTAGSNRGSCARAPCASGGRRHNLITKRYVNIYSLYKRLLLGLNTRKGAFQLQRGFSYPKGISLWESIGNSSKLERSAPQNWSVIQVHASFWTQLSSTLYVH